MRRVVRWLVVASLFAGLGPQAACTDEFSSEGKPLPKKDDARVPSTALTFGEIIAPEYDKDGSGWQAMCLHLEFERHVDDVSEGRSPRFTCSMQIGFPMVLGDGTPISERDAKEATASSLDEAITKLDTQGPTVSVCTRLQKETEKLASKAVKGAKILKNCPGHKGKVLPEVRWTVKPR